MYYTCVQLKFSLAVLAFTSNSTSLRTKCAFVKSCGALLSTPTFNTTHYSSRSKPIILVLLVLLLVIVFTSKNEKDCINEYTSNSC